MSELHFWLLIEISPIHSEKIILALKDFSIMGYSRKEVCERHNISSGYFSGGSEGFSVLCKSYTANAFLYSDEITGTLQKCKLKTDFVIIKHLLFFLQI
ncbi:PapB/FocB family fimbrial expression transcriptional regulator [Escherichia coli]